MDALDELVDAEHLYHEALEVWQLNQDFYSPAAGEDLTVAGGYRQPSVRFRMVSSIR